MATSDELDAVLPLTPTVYHVLVSLAQGPRHGYAIAREVEELTEGRIVMGPGTLYGSLQRMEQQRLIEEASNPGDEGSHSHRRRYHRITALGSAALRVESERLFRAVRLAQQRLGA